MQQTLTVVASPATLAVLTISESAIFNNTVLGTNGDGGGVFLRGADGDITNVTISGNRLSTTNPDGAGLYVTNGQVTLRGVSIVDNVISGPNAQGSALASDLGAYDLANSLVVGSCDDALSIIDMGGNLESPSASCGLTTVDNAQLNLAGLANNGGATPTHALGVGSVAIDAGTNQNCSAIDQRGVQRPIDGDGNGSSVCDVGAYEAPAVDSDFIFRDGFESA